MRPAQRRSSLVDIALWIATVTWVSATIVWSLGPVPPGAASFPGADKVFHALAYGVAVFLAALAADDRPGRGPGPFPGSAIWIAVAATAVGGLFEILQHFTGRDSELRDWLADGVGAALGWLMWRQWCAIRSRRSAATP